MSELGATPPPFALDLREYRQDRPRLGGSVGVATVSEAFGSYGQVDAIIGDSIGLGAGATAFGSNDWASVYAIMENRVAGLPDPGIGFVPCTGGGGLYGTPQWSSRSGGAAVTGLSPAAIATALQLNGVGSVIGDSRVFRRVLVFYANQASSYGIQLSTNGGSSYSSTVTPAGSGVGVWDSGDLFGTLSVAPALSVKQVSVAGASVNPVIYGCRYYQSSGTTGLVMDNLAQDGSKTSDWTGTRTWETYIGLTLPRRLHIVIGENDALFGGTAATMQSNLATIVQRAQAASPFTEIVIHSEQYASNATLSLPNVGFLTWTNSWVPLLEAVAQQNGCTYLDHNARFGNCGEVQQITDGITTSNSRVLTTASSTPFTSADVGALIVGPGIPYNTTIVLVNSSSNITLSKPAAATASSLTLRWGGDFYGLTVDSGLHFGVPANSASGRDGQRARAEFVYERLSVGNARPLAQPAVVTLATSTNWLCPASGLYRVTAVGGGGGGGGGGSATTNIAQSGGGGGGQGGSTESVLSLTGGTLYGVTIGGHGGPGTGGGAGGHAGTFGGVGAATTFGSPALLFAVGGGGGSNGAANSVGAVGGGGAGGTPTGTQTPGAGGSNFGLGAGGGIAGFGRGAGGGGCGGSAGSGTGLGGGAGGAGSYSGGGGSAGATGSQAGAAGATGTSASASDYGAGGGGGGGGTNNTGAGGNGGSGAPGVVFVEKVG
jgi:hypothetical protein